MKSAFLGLQWLRHYIFSDTLHGTHSPFVYKFLETIIYNTRQLFDERNTLEQLNVNFKYLKLIYRISNFYHYESVLLIKSDAALYHLFPEDKIHATNLDNPVNNFDIIYFGEFLNEEELKFYYHQHKEKANEKSMFIFPSIRKNKKYLNAWLEICADEKNLISIDFFDMGIMFFEQKKPKEHFNIYYK